MEWESLRGRDCVWVAHSSVHSSSKMLGVQEAFGKYSGVTACYQKEAGEVPCGESREATPFWLPNVSPASLVPGAPRQTGRRESQGCSPQRDLLCLWWGRLGVAPSEGPQWASSGRGALRDNLGWREGTCRPATSKETRQDGWLCSLPRWITAWRLRDSLGSQSHPSPAAPYVNSPHQDVLGQLSEAGARGGAYIEWVSARLAFPVFRKVTGSSHSESCGGERCQALGPGREQRGCQRLCGELPEQ